MFILRIDEVTSVTRDVLLILLMTLFEGLDMSLINEFILIGLLCLILFIITITIFPSCLQKTKEFLKIVNECRLQHETQDLSFKTAVKFMMVSIAKIEAIFKNIHFRLENLTSEELLTCTKIMRLPDFVRIWPDLILL